MIIEQSRPDPLLSAAKVVVGSLMAFFGLVGLAVATGLGAIMTVQRDAFATALIRSGLSASAHPTVALALALIVGMFGLCILFLRELLRIVRSVERGDPFVPVNADRLQRMGWLNVAIQLILFALAGIGVWLGDMRSALLAEDAINLGLAAVVLTLVLFVLARVFRVGSQMREELEGTV